MFSAIRNGLSNLFWGNSTPTQSVQPQNPTPTSQPSTEEKKEKFDGAKKKAMPKEEQSTVSIVTSSLARMESSTSSTLGNLSEAAQASKIKQKEEDPRTESKFSNALESFKDNITSVPKTLSDLKENFDQFIEKSNLRITDKIDEKKLHGLFKELQDSGKSEKIKTKGIENIQVSQAQGSQITSQDIPRSQNGYADVTVSLGSGKSQTVVKMKKEVLDSIHTSKIGGKEVAESFQELLSDQEGRGFAAAKGQQGVKLEGSEKVEGKNYSLAALKVKGADGLGDLRVYGVKDESTGAIELFKLGGHKDFDSPEKRKRVITDFINQSQSSSSSSSH